MILEISPLDLHQRNVFQRHRHFQYGKGKGHSLTINDAVYYSARITLTFGFSTAIFILIFYFLCPLVIGQRLKYLTLLLSDSK